jgi:hypothetical protein
VIALAAEGLLVVELEIVPLCAPSATFVPVGAPTVVASVDRAADRCGDVA